MKKITFLAMAFIMGAFGSNASEAKNRWRFDDPITFIERGITFYVFPNGEFDFNTEATAGNDLYYRGTQTNTTYGANAVNSRPVIIEHDGFGRVRRIGNVFVNYDNASRIKRIGSVYMTYYRSALSQIGGLRLIYDRRGNLIDMIGAIKHNQSQVFQYQPATYYGPAQYQNEDYYYKADGTKVSKEISDVPRK